jgi:hypothetical protein
MATVQDLINEAYILTGDLALEGQSLTSAETAYAVLLLNDIIDEFSLDKLLAFARTKLTLPLTISQQSYTIGIGGNFNVDRPINIQSASIFYLGQEYPLNIIQLQQWQNIIQKSDKSNIPIFLYMDNAFPLNNLNLYPIPMANADLILYTPTPLTTITDANLFSDIPFPIGYKKALKFVLAEELLIGKQSNPVISQKANEAKDYLRQNSNNDEIILESAFDGCYSDFTSYSKVY